MLYLLESFILGVWNFLNLCYLYWYLFVPLAAGIVACPFLIRFLRAAFHRVFFIRKIQKICNRQGQSCQVCRPSFLSLFSKRVQIDVILSFQQKKTALCFFPGNPLKKNIYIRNRNCAFYTKPRALSFFRNHTSGFEPSLLIDSEGRKKAISIEVPIVDNGECILIIHPAPIALYAYLGNGYKMIGSGEEVDSLIIYEGLDYINFLLRAF